MKISRYLTVITVAIGLASVRMPVLIATLGHWQGWTELSFVFAHTVSGVAAVVSLLFALSALTYAKVPKLAVSEVVEPDAGANHRFRAPRVRQRPWQLHPIISISRQ